MGPFEIAAIAIIGAFSVSAYKEYNKRHSHSAANAEVEALQAELEQVKQRVATLETIVTDKSYQLGKEIDRL
ncbi:hypothetical protein FLM48_04230 [Shewanella sp. Scap07]|uniref:hypothetical protein n=1 Tax=Shewanella sp. Scap07 TaxID=2589987 RepID=UPI0015BD3E78|nr:hypothetical protein [Shewanella sp. Scap07]QLE84364.1 hypothetical protein FLM48_04230 [Shewanella sp. Scap07]